MRPLGNPALGNRADLVVAGSLAERRESAKGGDRVALSLVTWLGLETLSVVDEARPWDKASRCRKRGPGGRTGFG